MKNLKKLGIVALLAFVVVAGPLKKTVAPVSAVAETVENNPVLTKKNFKRVKDFFKPISNYLGKKVEDGLNWIILKSAAEEHTLTEAEFVRAVDGDTIVVMVDGEQKKVRLLSINTEESVHEDESRNNEYGRAASEWLKAYMEDVKTVWLEYDQKIQDDYGRDLCYVWLKDGVDVISAENVSKYMLNGKLVAEGYAYRYVFEPNTKYETVITDIQNDAINNKIGLWAAEDFKTLAESKMR